MESVESGAAYVLMAEVAVVAPATSDRRKSRRFMSEKITEAGEIQNEFAATTDLSYR